MREEKKYQALIEDKIFFGGANDVKAMIEDEQVEVIVDLREEAVGCAYPSPNVTWVQIPLGDNAEGDQALLFKLAIDEVTKYYHEGKKVGFHCGGGKGRTGAVAIGTLISLGKSQTIDEAEHLAKTIRPIIQINQSQRETLEKIFN
jgi:protein-tyrosine phosphatase